jgi:glutamyl-tRNA reductase
MTSHETGVGNAVPASGTGAGRLACLSVAACRVPLSLLERLSVPPQALAGALSDVRARSGADQVCILSTCERTEVYAWWSGEGAPQLLLGALAANRGVDPCDLHGASDLTVGGAAVRHLLRVTSGMDSFVLGEKDIVGQVRAAAEASRASAGGLEVRRLLDAAVSTSRRVHRGTELGVAEQIIVEEVDRYLRWLAGRSAVAALRRLRAGVEARTARLVEEAMRGTAESMRPLVEDRVRREMRQLAHAPTRALLEAAAAGNAALVEALSRAAWDSSQSGLGCGVSATPR